MVEIDYIFGNILCLYVCVLKASMGQNSNPIISKFGT